MDENQEQHWTQDFSHDSVTDENREAFVKANEKYSSKDEAVVGGYNAQKMAGKPYKIPETLDNLDDDGKADFTAQAHKALGINIAKDTESFKDVNMSSGLKEGAVANEALTGLIQEYAVEKGWPVRVVQDLAEFNNGKLAEFVAEITAKQTKERELKCHEDLCKLVGSEEEVKRQTELFRRAIMDKVGGDKEKAQEIADAFVKGGLNQTAESAKILLDFISPHGKEGSTIPGAGGGSTGEKQLSPYEAKKVRWPESPSEWGDESDKWENETKAAKNALGYKDAQ